MGMERWGFSLSVVSSPIVYFSKTTRAVCTNINPTMLCTHVCDVNYAACYCTNHSKRNFNGQLHIVLLAYYPIICMNIGVIRNRSILMTKQTNLPPNSYITLDALLCACSIYNIHRGVLGTTNALQWIRIPARYVWTGEFHSNTLPVFFF